MWVCLGDTPADAPDGIPIISHEDDPAFRRINTPVDVWQTSCTRMTDNFLDITHFPYVHVGTFGRAQDTQVPRFEMEPLEDGWYGYRYEVRANNSDLGTLASGQSSGVVERAMSSGFHLPFDVRSTIRYGTGLEHILLLLSTPIDDVTSYFTFVVWRNDDFSVSAEEVIRFDMAIGAEDKRMLELLDGVLPLDQTALGQRAGRQVLGRVATTTGRARRLTSLNPVDMTSMRLIATDLDGTLLGAGGTLSDRNVRALHAAKDAGWYVVLASGRPPFMVAEYLPRLADAVTHGVLANGSIVCTLPDQEMLRAIRFGVSMATDVVVRLRSLDLAYGFAMATDVGFAHEDGFAERMPSMQPVPASADVLAAAEGASEAIKLMVFHRHHTAHQLLDVLPPLLGDDLSVTHMGADCVEVGPTGIDKGTGLAWLCADLGVGGRRRGLVRRRVQRSRDVALVGSRHRHGQRPPADSRAGRRGDAGQRRRRCGRRPRAHPGGGMSSRHRVVVIGAGFGGLNTVRGLRSAPVDITLVDSHNFHTFQPLLYQVATAGLNADDVGYAVRGIFRRQRNLVVRMGSVDDIDVTRRLVYTNNGPPIEYDTLVVAAGAVSNTFGVEGVDEHAFPLKSIDDAVELRTHLLGLFETTAADPSTAAEGTLDVVVCGGGPTGVEMAGGLVELYDKVLAKDFPQLDVAGALITLVEAGPRLLGTFTEPSGRRAMRTLERRGVQVITGVGVDMVTADAVHLADGRRIAAQTVVWAAGVRASPLAELLDVPLSRWRADHGRARSVGRSSARDLRGRRHRRRRGRSAPASGTASDPRRPARRRSRSPTGWRVGRPRRSATRTRARWRPSVVSTRWPSSRTACGSVDRSVGWPGWACTSCT